MGLNSRKLKRVTLRLTVTNSTTRTPPKTAPHGFGSGVRDLIYLKY